MKHLFVIVCMSWSFAIVNKRLVEIYFYHPRGETVMRGHAYVHESEYKTKREQQCIKSDTAKYQFSYRKGQYRDLQTGKVFKAEDFGADF